VHVSSPALNGVNAIRFGCTYTLARDCSAFVYVNGFFFNFLYTPSHKNSQSPCQKLAVESCRCSLSL